MSSRRAWDSIRVVTSLEDLFEIYRFRYQIYVEEMNRIQHDADHCQKCIKDFLDDGKAVNIAAFKGKDIVGVLRLNFSCVSNLGYYSTFYSMESVCGKDMHPEFTCIVTRLMIKPGLRSGLLAVKLCQASYELTLQQQGRWCFIDCNDHLISFFLRLGFRSHIQRAYHKEYGLVNPMYLDLLDEYHLTQVRSPFLPILQRWKSDRSISVQQTMENQIGHY